MSGETPMRTLNPWVEGEKIYRQAAKSAGIPIREAAVNAEGLGGLSVQGLHLPDISQAIVEAPFEGFPMRTLLKLYSTPNNNTIMIPKELGSKLAVVTRVAEGAEIPLNFTPFEGTQCTTYKIGEGIPVPHELQQYEQAPFVEQRIRHLSFKMKHTENVDIITAVGAAVPAANVIVATGMSLGQDMTQATIAGTIGQYDVDNGLRILRQNFKWTPGVTLLVNAVGFSQLARLPMYNSMNQVGEPRYRTNYMYMVQGCTVVVSEDVPAGVAYLIGTDPLSYPTGQFTPVGYFIESRPMTTMEWDRPDLDSYMIYAVHEYTPCITYPEGIVQITYTSYS